MVSLSTRVNAGHIEIRRTGHKGYWTYLLDQHKWEECKGITLNDKEKDILTLSAQGYTMNEIADKLCIAIDTVKYYKRKIFERMEVKNITETLSFAINYKLL